LISSNRLFLFQLQIIDLILHYSENQYRVLAFSAKIEIEIKINYCYLTDTWCDLEKKTSILLLSLLCIIISCIWMGRIEPFAIYQFLCLFVLFLINFFMFHFCTFFFIKGESRWNGGLCRCNNRFSQIGFTKFWPGGQHSRPRRGGF